jgi:hypothetical protein
MTRFGAIRIHKRCWVGTQLLCSSRSQKTFQSKHHLVKNPTNPTRLRFWWLLEPVNSPELSDTQNLSKTINIICFIGKTRCFPYYIYSYIQKLLDQSKLNLSHVVALAWVYESDNLPFLYHSYTCGYQSWGKQNGLSSSSMINWVLCKVTLSLGLLSLPIPSFSGMHKVMKFY